MEKESNRNLYQVAGDIFSVIDLTKQVGWDNINELSIQRIIYLSSVLYAFKHPDDKNPFLDDYDFAVDLRGPFNNQINKSILLLIKEHYIQYDQDSSAYFRGENEKIDEFLLMPNYETKRKWFEVIIYILGIYGESKIYDFVYRDPEFLDNLRRLSTKELNIDSSNKTRGVLIDFKAAFEESLGDQKNKLNDKDYLEMYFNYVFSRILKGEKE